MKYILAALVTLLPLNLMGFCRIAKIEEYDQIIKNIEFVKFTIKEVVSVHDEGKLTHFIIYYD